MTRRRFSMWNCSSTLAYVVSSIALAGAPPEGEPPASTEPTRAVPGVVTEQRKLPPLLREGTFLSRASGAVREDPTRKEWIFTPDTADRDGLRREFVLLPNEPLGDATRTVRLAPGPIAFEASGEVFIYHGRNYLLPSLLTPFVPQAVEAAPEPAPEPAKSAPPSTDLPAKPASTPQPARAAATSGDEAIVDELERKLAERIDRLPKTPVAVPAPAVESAKESTPKAPGEQASGAKASDERASSRPAPVAGGTQIQSRRGQLLRDNATGGWRFVFDGQNAAGGEPSMAVLPCLALERIETIVRQSDVSLALTVTGRTTEFEGRTYLLPTLFRVARGGKGLNP